MSAEAAVAHAMRTMPKLADHDSESDLGIVDAVSGPVVTASHMFGAQMYELVRVGPLELIGEVIKLDGERAVIQVYEETSGLMVGDPVLRCHSPLTVELGPGIMGTIYDGIQRPLDKVARAAHSSFITRGIRAAETRALDHERGWEFEPADLREGDVVTGGTIFGTVRENRLMLHRLMVPPLAAGRVAYLAAAGTYSVDDVMLRLADAAGNETEFTMCHTWPVRTPRPVAEKLMPDEPLITGQRVLDAMFGTVLGGTQAIPGAFGCGKTVISQAISKHSNAQGVIYTAVGERGNEVAEVLMDFPSLTTEVVAADGTREEVSIMNRTSLIANTSNMVVAAREASIYTGITLAEYYRDMGYHFAVLADSTSRWAEALRELAGRLAELPSDAGFPAYMSSRLAQFYERGGLARCLGSPDRQGSVTIVGAVSPPGGDLDSDPVCKATLAAVQVFWALDKKLAQRKHFPSVNWLRSYSRYETQLEPWYAAHEPDFPQLRRRANEILRAEDNLAETVQLVGRDSLSEADKVTLDVAAMIREDFLAQNSYTPYDYYCPFVKTAGMLRCIVRYEELAQEAVGRSTEDARVTWAQLRQATAAVRTRIGFAKQVDPRLSEDDIRNEYRRLCDDITAAFLNAEQIGQ